MSQRMFIFVNCRPGSTIAIVQLQFEKDVLDPLKPLSDDITDGAFGPFKVARQLDFNPSMSGNLPYTLDLGCQAELLRRTAARMTQLTAA